MDRHTFTPETMNPPFEAKDRSPADADSGTGNYGATNFLYNPFSSQQQRIAQAVMQHRDPLAMMRDQQRHDNILAAAVQHQLVASLASPSIQFFGQHLGSDLQGSLLSRGPSNPTSTNFMQAFQNPSTSLAFFQRPGTAKDDLIIDNTTDKGASAMQIPCQARGMATDHNSMTAYFEVPGDAAHGQHLYCSHPVCRASGVKFRYCLYCKKPVTKQNFRSRHLHAELDEQKAADPKQVPNKKRTSEEQASGAALSEPPTKKGAGSVATPAGAPACSDAALSPRTSNETARTGANSLLGEASMSARRDQGARNNAKEPSEEEEPSSSAISPRAPVGGGNRNMIALPPGISGSAAALSTDPLFALMLANSMGGGTTELIQRQLIGEGRGAVAAQKEKNEDTTTVPTSLSLEELGGASELRKGAIQAVSRRRRWASLLAERPQSLNTGFDAWMSKVVFVSDMSRDWQVSGEIAPIGDDVVSPKNSVEQLSKWKSLLKERPSNTESGAKVSAWLARVIEVSCVDYDPSVTSFSGAASVDSSSPPPEEVSAAAALLANQNSEGSSSVEQMTASSLSRMAIEANHDEKLEQSKGVISHSALDKKEAEGGGGECSVGEANGTSDKGEGIKNANADI